MSDVQKDDAVNLLGLDLDGLKSFFAEIGEKPFRASQVMKWIHQFGVSDFDDMTNLSKALREKLKASCVIRVPEIVIDQTSNDGTRKWLLRLDNNNCIETVYIPENDRGTLCISSQVGCALECTFCATAKQGFNRNLAAWEIIGQMWVAHKMLGAEPKERKVTNVVFMGMGEPLLNLKHVIPTAKILMDDNAYGLSKRRVTISTSGVVPAMDNIFKEIDVSLAISLHAPNDELRDVLVPINQKYPLKELMAACQRYIDGGTSKRHILIEYVMLKDVNDQPKHAREMIRLLKGMPVKVNLIPFNPFEDSGYETTASNDTYAFQTILHNAGIRTTTRKTRGDDIDAACGQLAGKVKDRTRRTQQYTEIPVSDLIG